MGVSNGTIKDIVSSLKTDTKIKNSTYQAEVTRIDKQTGVAYVRLAGSDRETPTELTAAEVKKGDSVTVEWRNNKLYIGGNYSSPSVGTQRILIVEKDIGTAQQTADTANETAKIAKKTADTAKQIAGNTDQYFWHTETGTDTGAHITEVPKEDFEADPTNGGGNLLARSNGIAVRDGLTELATFGASGAQIGKSGAAHSVIDANGQRFYGGGNLLLAHIGISNGVRFYTMGDRATSGSEGELSFVAGSGDALGDFSQAMGDDVIAEKDCSTALGDGSYAAKESQLCIGTYNIKDTASSTHPQSSSHPTWYTDCGKYVFIIGNGTDANNRSNALAVDWDGNVETAGDITVGGHDSPIGSRLSAVWTASSSSASGTAMTGSITLTPGVWMLGMITPTCSTSKAYYFANISSSLTYPYFTMGTGGSGWVPVEIESDTTTYIASGASTSCTYSNLTRGRILAVRIA